MDVIEAHARRLPPADGRWVPRPHTREQLAQGLLAGKVAGVASHLLDNVRGNIRMLLDGDADKRFGMTGLVDGATLEEVLALVGSAAGRQIDPGARHGEVMIAPEPVLDACEALGDRLAGACARRERVVLATGHPVGLGMLYLEIARLAAAGGAEVLRPADGLAWKDPENHRSRQIRYLGGVAMLTDESAPKHTHAPDAMQRMLADARPDLVVADHGFAGAAIQAGVETASIADVNDPALIVAKARGRTQVVVVMDDNVEPDAYWPCFQAVASGLETPA